MGRESSNHGAVSAVMKLNIEIINDPGTGQETVRITDDRGERLPCVRKANINYDFAGASTVTLEILVDQKHVTLGTKTHP